jgi:hypothetical protein
MLNNPGHSSHVDIRKSIPALIVKGPGGGGLGDRLWSVLVGILYCRLSGRAIFVDWTDGLLAKPGVNAFTELFSTIGLEVLKEVPDKETSIHPLSWQGRLKRSLHEVYVEDGNPPWDRLATIKRYSFDLSKLNYPERVLVMWDFDQLDKLRPHLSPELAVCGQEELLRTIFRKHIAPHPELAAEAAQRVPHDGVVTVGVHVRATHEALRQKGLVPLNAYFRLVDRLSADGGRVVLATDNKEVEDLFRQRYPHIITRSKWFARPGEPLHLNATCPDRLQNTRDALIEMLMLARCDYLITQQNSAFSMMTRVASGAPPENIFLLHSRMPFSKRVAGYWKRVVKRKVAS